MNKVELIQWNEELRTGVDVIDEQHQELIGRANNLFSQGVGEASLEKTIETLDYLADYVIMHFSHEEKWMEKLNFPGLAVHKAEHDAFIERYKKTRSQCEECSDSMEIVVLAANLVSKWLVEHIAITDKEMAGFIKNEKKFQ